jgi:hypothetical protein
MAAVPAADWIQALAEKDLFAIIPGFLGPDDEIEVDEALAWGELSTSDIETAVRDSIEAVAGRPWWEATRLVAAALGEPDVVFGHLVERGFDFERQSLGAFCAAVYAVAVRSMDKKDRLKFDMTLKTPPVDVVRDDADAMSDAFMQAMREQTGFKAE